MILIKFAAKSVIALEVSFTRNLLGELNILKKFSKGVFKPDLYFSYNLE
jgi:hypothetical protein